jgi:ABC-type oligopeptide transport system ATPase subunit
MSALAIMAVEMLLPSLLGGSTLGVVIAGLKNPLAGKVITIAKRAARGDHLSDESKRIFAEYKRQYPYNRWHRF